MAAGRLIGTLGITGISVHLTILSDNYYHNYNTQGLSETLRGLRLERLRKRCMRR
jgi:hypothetical protein